THEQLPESQAGNRRLRGKVAIITGASRGIGAAIARLFAREGATVVLASRNVEELNWLASDIASEGGTALAVTTNVADAAAMEALVARTMTTYGRLDIAVNNAGVALGNKPLTEVSEEQFDQTIAVNLKGVFLALKCEIPAMLASNGGAIVNMSSTVGLVGSGAGIAPYIASKHGVVGLTKAAALEYASQRIRVNAIAPGTTATSVNEHWLGNPAIRERITATIPMGRIGEARDVAEAALWLCSDASSYVTGVVLPVDGGYIVP
ncbi:MAG TPA: SDR family oxidoreductase, partial [Ktedonobacterales bacterium]|nr:SDR family oxidoreductase [Ktedonobacterales bacterium]